MRVFISMTIIFFLTESLASWQAIMTARAVEELVNAETQIQEQQNLQKGCRLEINKKWFPENCLFWLNYKMQTPGAEGPSPKEFHGFEQLCALKVGELSNIRTVQRILNLQLPSSCRYRLEERLKDLQYIEGGPEIVYQAGYE